MQKVRKYDQKRIYARMKIVSLLAFGDVLKGASFLGLSSTDSFFPKIGCGEELTCVETEFQPPLAPMVQPCDTALQYYYSDDNLARPHPFQAPDHVAVGYH